MKPGLFKEPFFIIIFLPNFVVKPIHSSHCLPDTLAVDSNPILCSGGQLLYPLRHLSAHKLLLIYYVSTMPSFTLSGCSMNMLWKRERPREMTHWIDFSLPYWKPQSRVKNVDTPLIDSSRNQPRNTHHQGSEQPEGLFFLLTGVGLEHRRDGERRRKARKVRIF